MDNYTINLYKLTHLNIDVEKSFATYNDDNSTTLNIYLNASICKCIHCYSYKIYVRATITSKINYSIYVDQKVDLILHRRKYHCKECNRYFIEPNPIVSANRNISFNTDLLILDLLKSPTMTYTKAAELTNTSASYVQKVFDNRVVASRGRLSTVICIDEVYAKNLVKYKYICNLFNPFDRTIIDVLDSRHKQDIIDFTAQYSISERLKVKYVSIDLWDTYRDVAELSFPKALILADSFHVIKNLNKCFDNVRKRTQKNFEHLKSDKNSYYWIFKKYFKFLLKDFDNIYSGQIRVRKYPYEMYMYKDEILKYLLSFSEELKLAYELKEEYRQFNKVATIKDAEQRLNDMISLFKKSKIKEYYPFIKLLENWKQEIINSFTLYNGKRIHNGYIERMNLTIEQLFFNGFGFTNFPRTRNRIMYVINDGMALNGKDDKPSNKIKGKPRGPYKK